MMRNRNKIVVRKKPLAALLLAGVVLLGMSVPVSADERMTMCFKIPE